MPLGGLPVFGEEGFVAGFGEAAVDEEDEAAVGFGADDAAGGLEDAVHAGESVGVVVAVELALCEALADEVAFEAELGEADADDNSADEAVADEVDAFAENAAEYGETDLGFGGVGGEGF